MTMPVSSGKEELCLKHEKTLDLFCNDDKELVCYLCEHSPEHEGHTVLLLEKAGQQQKDKIFNCLETLKVKKKKIQACIANAEAESQKMLEIMNSEKQKAVDELEKLRELLRELENDLLDQIEKTKEELTIKQEKHLTMFTEELSSLENLIQEMEEKFQQPVSELLKDVKDTLQRYEEKKKFENPEDFLSELKKRDHYTPFLEIVMKQFQDTLLGAFPKLRANVTLDPASANSHLVVSSDWKSMAQEQQWLSYFMRPLARRRGFVLGYNGFTAGCHFWEVLVGNEGGWAVGVARKPVKGGARFLTPEEGIWAVGKWLGEYVAYINYSYSPLVLRDNLNRIRVCLNYDGGRVAFFDAERATLLYEFSGAPFSGESIYPFFSVRHGRLSLRP